jgi:hypothetical protein
VSLWRMPRDSLDFRCGGGLLESDRGGRFEGGAREGGGLEPFGQQGPELCVMLQFW